MLRRADDVLRRPQDAELIAPGRQFPDEAAHGPVVGVPAGLVAEHGDHVGCGVVPLGVEAVRPLVEEDEPAWFTGRAGCTYISENRARPSSFVARMSPRPLRITAGTLVTLSSPAAMSAPSTICAQYGDAVAGDTTDTSSASNLRCKPDRVCCKDR